MVWRVPLAERWWRDPGVAPRAQGDAGGSGFAAWGLRVYGDNGK